jgi:ribosome-associated protein YbcJ (S4-like RNA binding protein)
MLIKTLNILDTGTVIRAILRRFYLIRLLNHRIQQEDYHENRKSTKIRTQRKQNYKNIK